MNAQDLAPQTQGAPALAWADSDLSAVWKDHDPAVACAALERVEEASRADARVFTAMQAAADGAGQARLHGTAFRLKDPASLARKIADRQRKAQMQGVNRSASEVAASLTDISRYTAVSAEHDQIPGTARALVDSLRARGWSVQEAEQSYVEGNPYKGLHLLMREPGGLIVEVQVHSERSQQIKDTSHLLYERSRAAQTPLEEKRQLHEEGERLWADLPAPQGMDELTELGGVPVTKKTYG